MMKNPSISSGGNNYFQSCIPQWHLNRFTVRHEKRGKEWKFINCWDAAADQDLLVFRQAMISQNVVSNECWKKEGLLRLWTSRRKEQCNSLQQLLVFPEPSQPISFLHLLFID
jgi:hypothetical protein